MHVLMVFLIMERNRLEKMRFEVDVIRHELEVA
jgi:hypothetical protein